MLSGVSVDVLLSGVPVGVGGVPVGVGGVPVGVGGVGVGLFGLLEPNRRFPTLPRKDFAPLLKKFLAIVPPISTPFSILP